jgi:BREX protein BrxB
VKKPTSRKERAEHLFKVVTSQRFLTKQGLGNEVPFFICPYPAEEGLSMVEDRLDLVTRITHAGIGVLDLSLYDLSLGILEERGILDQILEIEPDTDKGEIRDLLQSVLDPKANLIPRIGDAIEAAPHEVIFLSGVGEVYPYIRSHNVLNNLQSTAKDKPTVLFFPGSYTHALATGASLDLFERLHDDKYYRAFNILNYEV